METTTFTPKMSISHLLLHKDLLNWDAWVVNRIYLPAHWTSLITSCQWANAISSCSTWTNSLTSACCLSFSVETAPKIVVRKVLCSFVPHKACKWISLHELSIRLIRADHVELLLGRCSILLFLQYLKFAGYCRSRYWGRLVNGRRLWLLGLVLVGI